jgi:hypothetical protein
VANSLISNFNWRHLIVQATAIAWSFRSFAINIPVKRAVPRLRKRHFISISKSLLQFCNRDDQSSDVSLLSGSMLLVLEELVTGGK